MLTFMSNSCTLSPANTGWVWATTKPGTMVLPLTSRTRSNNDFTISLLTPQYSKIESSVKSQIYHSVLQNIKINSVCEFYNRCITTMGKRKLMNQIVSPTNNKDVLQKEYDIVDYILSLNNIEDIRNKLKSIKDIEKLTLIPNPNQAAVRGYC